MKKLTLIFIFALILRFLYFPDNIYFGFDQARDAFASQEILKGDLKIVGPPTALEGMFHGPLYYYFYAPIYFFSKGNPEAVSAFLRVINALGVFLIFVLGKVLFNKKTGYFAAVLYGISFEQSQFAIYFNHPALAVISMSFFYLGLATLFFQKNKWGIALASFSLGLSIQFEFVLVYLLSIFILLMVLYRESLPKINLKTYLISFGLFILAISSFIISEIMFQFRALKALLNLMFSLTKVNGEEQLLSTFLIILQRFIGDNLINYGGLTFLVSLILIGLFIWKMNDKTLRPKLLFLLIWLIGGLIPYLSNSSSSPLYYYAVGASLSVLLFSSYLISTLYNNHKVLGLAILIIPLLSSFNLVTTYNPKGSIPTINVQSRMLLSDEKKVIDYIYKEAGKEPFSVNALSMPLYVNTTWSYLFKWYGQSKYSYLPFWAGQVADGYPGSLPNVPERSKLPQLQFLIIEPTRGIRPNLIASFIKEENYFSTVTKESAIGDFMIQVRRKI